MSRLSRQDRRVLNALRNDKLLIVADRYQLALDYARHAQIPGHPGENWRYVFELDQLRSVTPGGRFVVLTESPGVPLPQRAMQDRVDVAMHLERVLGFEEINP